MPRNQASNGANLKTFCQRNPNDSFELKIRKKYK